MHLRPKPVRRLSDWIRVWATLRLFQDQEQETGSATVALSEDVTEKKRKKKNLKHIFLWSAVKSVATFLFFEQLQIQKWNEIKETTAPAVLPLPELLCGFPTGPAP